MGITAENNLWYKGKGEILRELRKNTGAVLSATASRNFSRIPGFAVEAMTDIEIDGKLKLLEHNQKIMSDAVERELRRLGIQNDTEIRENVLQWEARKQDIYNDIRKEFADYDQLRALRSDEIGKLVIDQEMRVVGIALAKLAIERQVQELSLSKVENDALLLPNDELLAAPLFDMATRKLLAIPEIVAMLAAQEELLGKELAVILPGREQKANFEAQEAQLEKDELLPLEIEKAGAMVSLTAEQATLIDAIIEKANKSMELSAAQSALLAPLLEKASMEAALTAKEHETLAPLLQKAAKTTELTAAQATLIAPMLAKAVKTGELTAAQATLIAPMLEKALKMETLVAKEAELIDPMQRKAAEISLLTIELARLFAPMIAKAQASSALAEEMMSQLANHQAIANEKVEKAELRIARLAIEAANMGKEIILDGKKITAERDRAAMELQRAQARLEIATELRVQLGDIKTAMAAEAEKEIIYIGTSGANEVTIKRSRLDNVEKKKFDAQKIEIDARTNEVKHDGEHDRTHNVEMAQATAEARVTEKLIHLLA